MHQLGTPVRHHVCAGGMNGAEQTMRALRETGVTPHRLRGQNFLLDTQVLERIVGLARREELDAALEIGAGLGALSLLLAERARQLTLLEIEPAFAARLQALFADRPHVTVLQADALAFDYAGLAQERRWSSYAVFGNIPYHITTPLLQRLLPAGGCWSSLTLLLQKEAARRICQGQGRGNGPLPLLAEYFGQAEFCFTVGPAAFYPRPAVDSAVIRIRRHERPVVQADSEGLFRLIEAAFAQRRKTLLNALTASHAGLSREQWLDVLAACGVKASARAEQLGLGDFARIYEKLKG